MLKMKPIFMAAFVFLASSAVAQTKAQQDAKKMLERIAGTKVTPDNPILLKMIPLIAQGHSLEAAKIAVTHPNFLNVTVKLMALQMSTREETIRLQLNDFAASFIGVTRDETDARELLYGNFFYKGNTNIITSVDPVSGNLVTKTTINNIPIRDDITNDIANSNNHYLDLEQSGIDIGQSLKRENYQPIAGAGGGYGINPDPAGVLTSRAFFGAHALAGTNRRPVEYTFRQFMCLPIGDWSDTQVSDFRIGRDIDRFPGGDNQRFQETCKGCHTQLDSFRGAFAYTDFSGKASAFGSAPVSKMNQNNTVFKDGFVTTDNSFINNSRGAANEQMFGWRGPYINGGKGIGQFGSLVANSQRFSQCMVKRVFEGTCRRQLDIGVNKTFIDKMTSKFEGSNYNLKQLFEQIVSSPDCK